MKKRLFTLLLIGVLLFSLIACEKDTAVTVDSIVKLFDSNADYYVQYYTPEMIDDTRVKMSNLNFDLKGDISQIVHIVDQSKSTNDPAWTWVYVYELTDEADAVAFAENRQAFLTNTAENGYFVRLGLIVVFGTSPLIASIET